MKNGTTADVSAAGVSIWLDDLSRGKLTSGELAHTVATRHVVGVTTNPAIFAQAIQNDDGYREPLSAHAKAGTDAASVITEFTCDDVAAACDVLRDVYERTNGEDGWVSLEVDPALAHDAAATIDSAQQLYRRVNRPNVMIKIPATDAGVEAITGVLRLGISVNVTLIFGLGRYRQVVNAYQLGLELARADGHDLSQIRSVASFFVSRLDSVVNAALDLNPAAAAVPRTLAGIANARLAYEIFQQNQHTERSHMLLSLGAHPQKLLWASTGVKDPAQEATLYVTELALPQTVNTMPTATLEAVCQGVEIPELVALTHFREADQHLNVLADHGIDYTEVTAALEATGVQQFLTVWEELHTTVAELLVRDK